MLRNSGAMFFLQHILWEDSRLPSLRKLGYSAENWEAFERHLRGLILSNDATKVEESPFGQKFVVEGPLGDTVQIITVRIILKAESIPRFVTVYPGGSL